MEEGQIRRWATVVENLRSLGHELPETVREWVARTQRVAAGGRDHRLRAAERRLLALQPHAAGRGRQHQHARPLPPRRGDRRRRARGLPDRARRSPTRWSRGGRVRGHHLLRAADRARVHDPGAADRPARDRGGDQRARRPPGRLLERRPGPDRRAARERRPLPRLRDARRPGRRRGRRQPRVPPALAATGSSRTCGPRGASSPGAASRCSARRSTWASRCSRSRCAGSSSR